MFISQPPPTEMKVYLATISSWGIPGTGALRRTEDEHYLTFLEGADMGTVSSREGLNIGDLYDSARTVIEKYVNEEAEHFKGLVESGPDRCWRVGFLGSSAEDNSF